MHELDQQIGKRLQQARKAAGFRSARAFARHHNIAESTYSQHETGKRSLSPRMVLHYCDCFKINPGWLVSGQGSGAATGNNDNEQLTHIAILKKALQQAFLRFSPEKTSEKIDEIVEYSLSIYKNVISATENMHAKSNSEDVKTS